MYVATATTDYCNISGIFTQVVQRTMTAHPRAKKESQQNILNSFKVRELTLSFNGKYIRNIVLRFHACFDYMQLK